VWKYLLFSIFRMIQEVTCFWSNGGLVLIACFCGFARQIYFDGKLNIAWSRFKILTHTKLKLLKSVRNLSLLCSHILIKMSAVVWLKKTDIFIWIVFQRWDKSEWILQQVTLLPVRLFQAWHVPPTCVVGARNYTSHWFYSIEQRGEGAAWFGADAQKTMHIRRGGTPSQTGHQ